MHIRVESVILFPSKHHSTLATSLRLALNNVKLDSQFPSIGNLQIISRSIHGAAHSRGTVREGLASCDWSFLAVVS